MATPYYTDDMMEFARSLENSLDFPTVITQMDDENGPYLIINFVDDEYQKHYQKDDTTDLQTIAQYLVNLKYGLEALGARVTFNVVEEL
jgi:hypothetical protein